MAEDKLIQEVLERFAASESAEATNRVEGLDDLRMKNGDQWPEDIKVERELEGRPYLTVNKVRTFTKQIIGDMRQQRLAVKVLAAGNGASKELADTYSGLIRQIEVESKAHIAYQTAGQGAVDNGFGYFRVDVDYEDESAFEQEIRVKRIADPFTVYCDPEAEEVDGRDSNYYFVSKWISRDKYKAVYGGKEPVSFRPGGVGDTSIKLWNKEKHVRVAEYWRRVPVKKKIGLLDDGQTVDLDDFAKIQDELKEQEQIVHMQLNVDGSPVVDQNGQPQVFPGPAPDGNPEHQTVLNPAPKVIKERTVQTHRVEQYIVDGEKVISGPNKWEGKFIPIIPVRGAELIIDGKRYYISILRDAKDPQRMYNYFRTTEVETVALQPRVPVAIGKSQVEEHEDEWANVNDRNLPYITYDDTRNPNPPQRMIAQQIPAGAVHQSQTASDEIKATTGIFDASLGNASREKSGVAITRRDQQSNRANFEYFDNLRRGVEFCGEILVDLIPKIYDTERQVVTLMEDGSEKDETINRHVYDEESGEWVTLNDLSVGKYKVKVSAGPSFQTQRQETVENLANLSRNIKDPTTGLILLTKIIKNMDWEGSTETSEQLEKLLPPGILEEENGPQQQQQGPNPEQIKDMLDIQGKKLVNTEREIRIQKAQQDDNRETAEVAHASAKAATDAILRKLPVPGGIQG